jgi:SAM-dependent methyltransferase
MKSVNCYLCGSSRSDILFKQEGFDSYLDKVYEVRPEEDLNWVICIECGFVYRNPVLDDEELTILYEKYDQDVLSKTTPDEYFDKIISLPNEQSENWKKIEWLHEVLTRKGCIDECKNILDIGCGGGTLLYTIREQMNLKTVYGVELNTAYANLAKRRLNADIRNESYKSGLFGKKFDLLVNTKVLEHVPDPLPFLKEMASDLDEGGFLFIEVPDVSDMYFLPPNHERFFIPHIFFFSENSLIILLGKAGFDVSESRVVKTFRNRSYLQVLAVKNRAIMSKFKCDESAEYSIVKEKVKKNMIRHLV